MSYKKMKPNFKIIFLAFILLEYSICANQGLVLGIDKENNPNIYKEIGLNGIFGLVTNETNGSIFNDKSLEKNTPFIAEFLSIDKELFRWECNLWYPEGKNVVILCQVKDIIYNLLHPIFTFEEGHLTYNDYDITIKSENDLFFEIKQYNSSIYFIYSEPFSASLGNKTKISLKFKEVSIGQPNYFLTEKKERSTFITYDGCSSYGDFDYTYCDFQREKIEEIFTFNTTLEIVILNEKYGIINSEFFYGINIEYESHQQEIDVMITNILNNISEINSLIAFETNITNISTLTTKKFNLTFWKEEENSYIEKSCFFKKYYNNTSPLLLFCNMDLAGTYVFFIEKDVILNNINYKYNFTIKQNDIFGRIIIDGNGKKIYSYSQLNLNYTLEDSYTINYFVEGAQYLNNITFNLNSSYIQCNTNIYAKRCIIPKSHFDGMKSGYYYLHYLNHLNKMSIAYDARSIYVYLPPNEIIINVKLEENKDSIIIGRQSIITIPFITDFDDTEGNIFNISDIEEKTLTKKIYIHNDYTSYYYAVCRLWKPLNGKIRLLCNLDNYFTRENVKITFENFALTYNEYTIVIKTNDYFNIKQKNYEIPFLYSDTQIINIEDGINLYDLKFKYDSYNNDELYLYSESNNNYITVDNCFKEEKEFTLACKMDKSNLIKKGQYKLFTLNDNLGSLLFTTVLDIIIDYNDTTINKEHLNVYVTYPIYNYTKKNQNFAYITSIVSINNIITDKFKMKFNNSYNYINGDCFIKKTNADEYALLLCSLKEEGDFIFESQTIELNDIHYKYNFTINKLKESTYLKVEGNGTQVFFNSPHIVNMTLKKSLMLKYIMSDPNYANNIIINQDKYYSDILYCNNIENVKICLLPLNVLEGKNNGYYYTYQLNDKIDYSNRDKFYDSTPFYIILPPNNLIYIGIQQTDNDEYLDIGKKGYFFFVTDYEDNKNVFNISDIEEKTKFNSTVTDLWQKIIYNVKCNLWKPESGKIRILCQLQENMTEGRITLNEVYFSYNDYNIYIKSNCSVPVHQYEYDLPFLYSGKQIIEIEKEKDIYELKFKILSYNNEIIYLKRGNIYSLDECLIEKKELICKIKKDILEASFSYLTNSGYQVYYYSENIGGRIIDSILDISIKYKYNIEIETIYINSIKLINNINEYPGYVAYETDVRSIPDLITNDFNLYFTEGNQDYRVYCFFKKNKIYNLLLLCELDRTDDYYHLSKIENAISLSNYHYKYDFIINPLENNELIYNENDGSSINYIIPTIIDFTYETSFILVYSIQRYYNALNLRLNQNSTDLQCKYLYGLLNCVVPLSHFNMEKTGYYFTSHSNHMNKRSIYYESNPIYVIIPDNDIIVLRIKHEDNKNIIITGENEIFSFVTDYNDTENNIIDNNFEISPQFETIITDDNDYNYNIICRLWKPINENIRIFCRSFQMFNNYEQNINIKLTNFTYKNYTFIVYCKEALRLRQINYNISFLYSNKQTINIYDERINLYELKFKTLTYNNDKLYLFGKNNNYASLDNCTNDQNDVHCFISKTYIEELLVLNNDQFKLGAINDNYGAYIFDNVFNITINFTITHKEDLYIEIYNLTNNITEVGVATTYETNINSIPNLNTLQIGNWKFKKIEDNPLLLLYIPDKEGTVSLGESTEEKIYDSIHYKYNFRIQPYKNNDTITIEDYGTELLLISPEILNFTLEEYLIVNYIFDSPYLANNLKLNPDSSDLKCFNLEQIKRCIIPVTHFQGKQSGYYYLHHSNHLNESSRYITSKSHYVILPRDDLIVINIKKEYNNRTLNIGIDGTLNIMTDYNDNEKNIFDIDDIEEKTSFETIIRDENNKEYNAICRLWKPKNEKLRLFCNLNRIYKFSVHNLTMTEVSFSYKNYTIYIYPKCLISINQSQYEIPFLYSDKQTINIEEGIDLYEFKFRADYYNNDVLIFYSGLSYNILDDCKIEDKDILCTIKKDNLEENLILYKSKNFNLATLNKDLGMVTFDSVLDITINYIPTEKTDIYIDIIDILTDISESGFNIAYETNITEISNLKTDLFKLSFYDFLNDKSIDGSCYLKKNSADNLILLCDIIGDGYYYILENDEELKINNISYKYNFIILPIYIYDVIKVAEFGTQVQLTYPNVLNYTIEESLIVEYMMPLPNLLNNIRLNPNSTDLKCSDKNNIKECIVPLSHFKGKESGYYHTYHTNHLNQLSVCYDSTPFYVILPNDNTIVLRIKESNNRNDINLGIKGTLYFITDYNDKEYNIFNIDDIGEKTHFDSVVIDQNNNKFNAECRLWKVENEKIRLFCNMQENLNYPSQYITLNTSIIKYNNHTIVVKFEDSIKVKQIWYNIPFLYSDKQTINIEEGIDLYEFKFKCESFNYDLLYMYAGYSYILLDSCNLNMIQNKTDNEVICTIQKNKLEENLIIFNNNISGFNLVAMNDNYGTIEFNSVFDIFIKHPKIERKKIYIKIHNLLNNITQLGEPVAYTTKYNGKLPNLISNIFLMRFVKQNDNIEEIAYCTLKKREGIDLTLLCEITDEGKFTLKPIKEDIVLPDIHYKYIFIIIPAENNSIVEVSDFGTDVQITYPHILNFTIEDSLKIEYVMSLPNYAYNIKLNPDSETDLDCYYISKLKTCIVPLSHFQGKKSGYYHTYHYVNSKGYGVFYNSAPFKVILPPDNIIILRIKEEYNTNEIIIGNKGIIYFITDYNDNEKNIFNISDIEEKTHFESAILDENNNIYNVKCRLWKPINDNLRLFCDFNYTLNKTQYIHINNTIFDYGYYRINITSEYNYLRVKQYNTNIPFLYSDKQIINIKEEDKFFDLKFKIGLYNSEILILIIKAFNNLILDECNIQGKDLICRIKKEKLEEIISSSENSLILTSHTDLVGLFKFEMVSEIIIHNNETKKEDVYIGITKLLENTYELENFITYETNVTSISNVITKTFFLKKSNNTNICFMKKTEDKNLLLLCYAEKKGNYSLGELTQEIKLDDINIKYNFIISPFINNEEYIVKDNGIYIILSNPQILDFNLNDDLIIEYYMPETNYENKIRLNPDSNDLECEICKNIKRCIVPKKHFEGKKSGDYYTYHINHLNEYSIYYELSPIKVILPINNELVLKIKIEDNISKITGPKGIINFIIDYNDYDSNIFNASDIENLTKFETLIIDNEENKYNVTCKLWKPINEKLRMLCRLNDILKYDIQYITIKNFTFEYKEYTITIISETNNIEIYQNEGTTPYPFIYADKQIINVEEGKNHYELKFKTEIYNGQLLEFYDIGYNEIIIDNCYIQEKELICTISKEDINNILNYNGESFAINILDDFYGSIGAEEVLNIELYNKNIAKENIYINITKLLNNYGDKNTFIAYETNITNISNIFTDRFFMNFNSFRNDKCRFKKSEGSNLLLLCLFENEGTFYLKQTEYPIQMEERLNIKYNFWISPIKNSESFTINNDNGQNILGSYPKILNFTEQDNITIIFSIFGYLDLKVRLNPDSEDLQCNNYGFMVKCNVTNTHFYNKKSGYYNTYYIDSAGNLSIFYEVSPFKVILSEENETNDKVK